MEYQVIKELLKQKEGSKSNDDYRRLTRIDAGEYYLSIQGSSGHYCDPRETLHVEYYNEMEIAIFDKEGEWVKPSDEVLKGFDRYNELIERADGSESCTVYGYVKVELINALYLYLKERR